MAAPDIAGIAALYLEAYPSAAAYQVHHLPFQLPTIPPFELSLVCILMRTRHLKLILSLQLSTVWLVSSLNT